MWNVRPGFTPEQALAQGTVGCVVTEVGGVLSQQHLYSASVGPGSSVWHLSCRAAFIKKGGGCSGS